MQKTQKLNQSAGRRKSNVEYLFPPLEIILKDNVEHFFQKLLISWNLIKISIKAIKKVKCKFKEQ